MFQLIFLASSMRTIKVRIVQEMANREKMVPNFWKMVGWGMPRSKVGMSFDPRPWEVPDAI